MAQINFDSADDLQKLLENLASHDLAKAAVLAAEPVLTEALKEECDKHHNAPVDKTRGEMIASIKPTGPKENQYGVYDFVRPTGKDSKGVRNMEKLAYLEYGTSSQAATPVLRKVVNKAAPKVVDTMQKAIEEKTK